MRAISNKRTLRKMTLMNRKSKSTTSTTIGARVHSFRMLVGGGS
jgi:hypothetical protein